EVRVVGGTNERVNADGFAFDELRLERLHRQTVQRRRAVQENRMALGHFFEDVPNFLRLAFDHLLSRTNGMDVTQFFQAANDKRLKQHESHFLGQTALIELKFGSDNDNGASRVVNALTEQVLAETSAFTFKHIAQGLQGAVARAGDRTAMAAVVEERVH